MGVYLLLAVIFRSLIRIRRLIFGGFLGLPFGNYQRKDNGKGKNGENNADGGQYGNVEIENQAQQFDAGKHKDNGNTVFNVAETALQMFQYKV